MKCLHVRSDIGPFGVGRSRCRMTILFVIHTHTVVRVLFCGMRPTRSVMDVDDPARVSQISTILQ